MQNNANSQRIIIVDALRGFALLGILLAHMIYWYTAGPLPGSLFSKYQDIATGIVSVLNEVLISGKFFAFFSFLFGLSFYLQMQSMEKRQDNFVLRYGWRIAILGIIGLIHHAFWQGDILSIYAPLGFILLPLRKLSNKWILVLGILFAVNLPGLIMETVRFLIESNTPPPPNTPSFDPEADGKEYYRVITEAGLPELWRYNLARLSTKFQFQLDSGRIFITFGFFLLGMYTGRKQWFETPDESRRVWKKICRRSGWLTLGTLLLAVLIFASNEIFKLGWQQNRTVGIIFSVIQNTNSAALVCFYVAGLTLLMYRSRWQKLLFPLASVGKLALTCYLGQTFAGLLLFYHVGFGLIGQTPPWLNWLIGTAYFLMQVILSRLWLKSFYYGPLEWLWRSLTFFKWYQFRRK
jgi:uncharacterized protein